MGFEVGEFAVFGSFMRDFGLALGRDGGVGWSVRGRMPSFLALAARVCCRGFGSRWAVGLGHAPPVFPLPGEICFISKLGVVFQPLDKILCQGQLLAHVLCW